MVINPINPIDPSDYARAPRLTVDMGLSLSKMLLMAIPDEPNPGIVMAANLLALSITELETKWNGQGKPTVPRDARPFDQRVDRSWNAIHARLTAWSVFPDDDPDRLAAEALVERLFPTGLDFLKLAFLAEHAQSERRIQIIDAEELRDDLDRLVGEVFIDHLLEAHAAYGEVLGITTPAETPAPREPLGEPLRALGEAIVAYAMQVIAFAALSPDHVEPAKRALQPIDAFRAAASRRAAANGSNGSASAEPDPTDSGLPEGAPAPDAPMPVLPAA